MDIEKLKQDLLKKSEILCADVTNYCLNRPCEKCELEFKNGLCLTLKLFIALCYGYALGADKQSVCHDIDKMLKDLFPNFYEHITKQEL